MAHRLNLSSRMSDVSNDVEAAGSFASESRSVRPRRPRLAASSYLNTAPLIWSFQHGTRAGAVDLVMDRAPARSAELLAARRVDAALVPVIELARMPDVELVPGVCVGAQRQVRSVVLATDGRDLKQVNHVSLDPASRTSVALARIIFREFLDRDVRFTVRDETRINAGESLPGKELSDGARLVIGDPAMRLDRSRWRVFDLAEVWRQYTNCGFVFAMWMRDATVIETADAVDFAAARDEGLAHVDEIIADYRDAVPLSDDDLRHYLRENISYTLDDEMLAGMTLFFRLAHRHKLIERVPETALARGLQAQVEASSTAWRFDNRAAADLKSAKANQ